MIVIWVEKEERLVRNERGWRTLVGHKPIELLGMDGGGEEQWQQCRSSCRCKCEPEYEQHRGVATE